MSYGQISLGKAARALFVARDEAGPGVENISTPLNWLDSVKAAGQALFEARDLHRVGCLGQLLRERAQFFRAQPAAFPLKRGEFRSLQGHFFTRGLRATTRAPVRILRTNQ